MKALKTIIQLLLFCAFLYPQATVVGGRIENFAAFTSVNGNSGFYFEPFQTVYLQLQNKLSENFQLRISPGLSFVEGFGGLELGAYLNYLPLEDVYFQTGVNFHFNGGEAHGTFSNYKQTYTLIGAGIGYNFSKYVFTELIFFLPSPKEWKVKVEYDYSGTPVLRKTQFDSIFKLGFGVNFLVL